MLSIDKNLLTAKQIQLARTLAERHGLDIPFDTLCDYDFGKPFLDLFAFDPDSNELTGSRRVSVIESYLYYDKNQKHLQFKLDLTSQEVGFMVMVLSKYKFKGDIPRASSSELDPEDIAFRNLEEELWGNAS